VSSRSGGARAGVCYVDDEPETGVRHDEESAVSTTATGWSIGLFLLFIVIGAVATYWWATRVPARRQFAISAVNSVLIGLLLGAAAVFGVTLMVQQDKKPPLPVSDGASILNRVEYGDRS
jgi:hypothetical protein